MNNFKLLFSVLWKERFRTKANDVMQKSLQPKILGKSLSFKSSYVMWIVVGICVLPMLLMIAFGMYALGTASVHYDFATEFVSTLITISQVVVLMVSLTFMISTLYYSQDAEVLLVMPIKSQTIFMTKLGLVYVIELATALLLSLVTLLPFGLGAQMSISYFLGLVYTVVLMPLFPMMIASIVAIPLMYLLSLFKNKGIWSTILLCVAFMTIFLGYYYIIFKVMPGATEGNVGDILSKMIGYIMGIGNAVFPNFLLAKALTASTFATFGLSIMGTIAINGALIAITAIIASKAYSKSISRNIESPKQSAGNNKKINCGSVGKELLNRDIKTIMRFSSLGFYCLMQLVMGIIFPIIMTMFTSTENSQNGLDAILKGNAGLIALGISIFSFFIFCAPNYAATGAISREGENFVIVKTLPITAKDYIKSKIKIGVIFNEITLIIAFVIFAITLGINILYLIGGFIIVSVAGLALVYLQTYVDLKKPKLHWKSVAEGLKNNSSSMVSFIAVLIYMVPAVLLILLGLALTTIIGTMGAMTCVYLLFFILNIVLMLIARNLLYKNCEKLLDEIEF
ncbi:MAG: hypothetical protein RR316_06165 [Clostridia bacterium]